MALPTILPTGTSAVHQPPIAPPVKKPYGQLYPGTNSLPSPPPSPKRGPSPSIPYSTETPRLRTNTNPLHMESHFQDNNIFAGRRPSAPVTNVSQPFWPSPQHRTVPLDVKDTQTVSPPNSALRAPDQYPPFYPSSSPRPSLSNKAGIPADGLGSIRAALSPVILFIQSKLYSSPALPTSVRSPRPSYVNADGTPLAPVSLIPTAETVRFVLLCSLWYASSAMSSNTGKSIMNRFKFPVTLTFIQFGFVAGYCVLFCVARSRMPSLGGSGSKGARGKSWDHPLLAGIQKPSRTALEGTAVMSIFQIAGHVFSSMAISRVPVSTVHTIKALSPLFTVVSYAILFRVKYSAPTYMSLLPLTFGVMLAISFDLRANAVGFLCALGSTIVFVSQNIFSKKLLPKESGSNSNVTSLDAPVKLDKLNLLLYSSGLAFVLMIPIWLYTDGSSLLTRLSHPPANAAPTSTLVIFFILNGSVHFAQNLLAFSILARTSPVTYSIASLIKRIAVICMAIIWFGQAVYPVQAVGICLTFFGLWMYNRSKGDVDKGEKKRGQMERKGEFLLPSTKEDARAMDGLSPAQSPLAEGKGARDYFPTATGLRLNGFTHAQGGGGDGGGVLHV